MTKRKASLSCFDFLFFLLLLLFLLFLLFLLLLLFLLFLLFLLLFSLSPPSTTPHIPYPFFSLLVAGGDEAVTPGSNDMKSTRLALLPPPPPPPTLSSLHSSLFPPSPPLPDPPPGRGVALSASIPYLLVSVSVEWQCERQGSEEWWMALPAALSLPLPRSLSSHCLPGAWLCR